MAEPVTGDGPAGPADPKGLIRESYAIEGIGAAECRSIFVDWALSLAPGTDPADAIGILIAHHADAAPGHPMTAILRAGLAAAAHPAARRGGRAGRIARALGPGR